MRILPNQHNKSHTFRPEPASSPTREAPVATACLRVRAMFIARQQGPGSRANRQKPASFTGADGSCNRDPATRHGRMEDHPPPSPSPQLSALCLAIGTLIRRHSTGLHLHQHPQRSLPVTTSATSAKTSACEATTTSIKAGPLD